MIALRPGSTLAAGRYEIVELLATGGMSLIWVGYDHSTSREVAIKVLRPEFAPQPSYRRRLRAEARANAMIAHPSVTGIYDFREEDSTGYLVLELVRGTSLDRMLDGGRRLDENTLLAVLAQAARALDATHRAGLVHRDVKPSNLLLTADGRVKLTDFGLAISAGSPSLTEIGAVPGTAAYLAPEQSLGRPAAPAADIYALGIVAYEALAGSRPFAAASDADLAVAHLRQPVPPLPGDVDPLLARLVGEMLSKEPTARPGPASILAGRFDAMRLGAAPVETTRPDPTPSGPPTTGWASRAPAPPGAASPGPLLGAPRSDRPDHQRPRPSPPLHAVPRPPVSDGWGEIGSRPPAAATAETPSTWGSFEWRLPDSRPGTTPTLEPEPAAPQREPHDPTAGATQSETAPPPRQAAETASRRPGWWARGDSRGLLTKSVLLIALAVGLLTLMIVLIATIASGSTPSPASLGTPASTADVTSTGEHDTMNSAIPDIWPVPPTGAPRE